MPTRLQIDAARHARKVRDSLAEDIRRMREDAGITRVALAQLAGVHPSSITKIEGGDMLPTLETYARLAAALGADLAARLYPTTGPSLHDRHQVRMAEVVLAVIHPRWGPALEVAVRRPARGWVDLVLHEPAETALVATELESGLHRIEQLIRWSGEKAESLPSASAWGDWSRSGPPAISRLLVVRWTRLNRDVASDARRQLREAYPADPRDALDALTGTAAWPGSALLWARIDRGRTELIAQP
jgi:transcriptional regulator with XRE-family HTH domain